MLFVYSGPIIEKLCCGSQDILALVEDLEQEQVQPKPQAPPLVLSFDIIYEDHAFVLFNVFPL